MSSGSLIAAVPTTMREAPASANASAVSKSRIPPPAWIFTVKRFAMARMWSRFSGVPVREPSRSTTWSHSAPSATSFLAASSGDGATCSAVLKSPLVMRTA